MNRLNPCARVFVPAAILASTGGVCFAAPVNDNFASATPLTAGVTASGTNVAASVQAGEPATHLQLTANLGTPTGLSVWYSYTSATDGLATFSVVGTGVGTAAAALQAGAYTGTAVNSLTRIASASAIAGTATAPGTPFASNLFEVHAGVPVYFQVTGNSAAGTSTFDITVTPYGRPGTIILPRYSSWEWLHPLDGTDPTTNANWAAKWKIYGDPTIPFAVDAVTPQRAPLAFAALDGAPGIAKDIGTPTTLATGNNAGYARAQFTLPADTSNLWAEVLVDDGAYIYIDDLPGFPVNIAAKLANTSFTTSTAFSDFRPQADVHITGAIPAANTNAAIPGCRAYTPAGYNAERNTTMVFLGGLTGKLTAGTHRIAVSLHQTTTGSSDMAFDLQLINMGAWPLTKPAGITFNDTPFVNSSTTATVVPVTEHTHAPSAGQTDLAWHCASPLVRGTTALAQACVVLDTTGGNQKTFRLNDAEAQSFVTEPMNVDGMTQFVASLRILAHETSTGFEAGDGFRVFLETSTDGVNFSEPVTPLDVQARVDGAAGLAPFKDVWVTKYIHVPANPYKFVRLLITGGVDSASESIYFDDMRFSERQLFPVVSNIVYDNKGNNDRTDDTVSFDVTVTGAGNTALNWTTTGFGAGNEVSGLIGGPSVTITRPATVAGVRTDVAFSVVEAGAPTNIAAVTVTTPTAAIPAQTAPVPVRNPGADLSTTSDDTFTYDFIITGTATGSTYEVRSSETGNATLYGTGTYGASSPITLPLSVTSVTIRDNSVTTLLRAITVPPAGTDIAMARSVLGGVNRIVYSNPAATAFVPAWKQTTEPAVPVTPIPPDLNLTVTETTSTMNAGAVIVAAERGVLESTPINLSGFTGVHLSATLRAWEHSTTSGFETADTFKLEVVETRAGGDTVVNLITGNPADANPMNDVLNGDAVATLDEFNRDGAALAGNSAGTFNFTYNIPADVLSVKVRATANNDSANEFFFLKDVIVTDAVTLDTDADGLPDDWENTNFGNLNQTGSGDFDGDGQSNASEFAAGTLPASGTSFLGITSSTQAGAVISLTFNSVSGKNYVAQSSPDLTTWTNIGSAVTASGASTTINGLPAGGPGKYYFRIKLNP